MVSLSSRAAIDPVLWDSVERLVTRFEAHHPREEGDLIRRAGIVAINGAD